MFLSSHVACFRGQTRDSVRLSSNHGSRELMPKHDGHVSSRMARVPPGVLLPTPNKGHHNLYGRHTRHSSNPPVQRAQNVNIVFTSDPFVEPQLCRRYNECRLEARRNQVPGTFLKAPVADNVCPNFECSQHRASDSPSSATTDQVTGLSQTLLIFHFFIRTTSLI